MADTTSNAELSRATVAALALHGAAIVSPLPVLLFRRVEIADNLGLVGGIVGEATMIGLAGLLASLAVPRLRDRVRGGILLVIGTLIAAAGLGLMAWTIEVGLFLTGGIFLAVGVAPGLVLPRIVLATATAPNDRFRAISLYWSSVAIGAGWPLAIQIIWEPSYTTVLWACFGLMVAAAIVLLPIALTHDEDVADQPTAGLTDIPWARRSLAGAFAGGAVVIGAADAAQALLVGEWQRSPEQTAAVLAAGAVAAALTGLFGPWYHRLHKLSAPARADAIGTQMTVAGVLVFIGALSFTYIALIVSWAIAGAALALAAAGLDTAVFPSLAPHLRRVVAARQVLAAGAGGIVAAWFNAIGGWSDQWQVAVTAIPMVAVGLVIRRYADSSRETATIGAAAAAATVPRRVAGLAGEQVPLLSVEGLDVAYDPVQVLFGVDLTVDEGEVVALLGTNGAGKTTLLRAISGLEPTIGGRIVYAGLDITKTRPTWRVGMGLHQVVGGEAVISSLTVQENMRLFAYSAPAQDRDEGIARAYELFPRLAQRHDQRAATLSGGEKQMLALAKPIIVPPRLLLIDEFSLGLAPRVIGELLPVVRQIAEGGASVLLVEQSVNIALSVADRAYVMEKGEIGFNGDAAQLRARPELLRAAYLEGLAQALHT